jgi:L-ascorbate metabolism protein UlaG (beta-lactamase superfamily)
MNKGGTITAKGLRITMTDARHSSSFDDNGIVYLGEAAGFVVRLENGQTIYFAGDTSLFGDMKLIGELYKPDIAFLPIGDRFTMGPDTAALAAQWLGVKQGGADASQHLSDAERHARSNSNSISRGKGLKC